MFKSEYFLMPDGSPMSPDEIAMMLNGWPGAQMPLPKQQQAGLLPYGVYATGRTIVVPKLTGPAFVRFSSAGDIGPDPFTYTSEQLYLYAGVIEHIETVVNKYLIQNITIEQFAISENVYYSLKDYMENNMRYSGNLWNTGSDMQLHTAGGRITFLITDKEFEITPLFNSRDVGRI